MGFIDYVVEYFRGPAGADGAPGATGPTGPEGPSAVHELTNPYLIDGGAEAGTYTASFTIPLGSTLLSADFDADSNNAALPSFTYEVTKTGKRTFLATLTIAEYCYATVNVRPMYYLP